MSPSATRSARRHSPASAGDQLARILEHERRTGHADRAVIGGLDALLERLAGDNANARLMLETLPDGGYAGLGPRERTAWIAKQRDEPTAGDTPTRAGSERMVEAAARPEPQRPEPADRPARRNVGEPLATAGFGLKPKQLERFGVLGIETARDALRHWPFRYHDFSRTLPIRQLAADEEQAVIGVIVGAHARNFRGGRGAAIAEIRDAFGDVMEVTWFNQPWLARNLPAGSGIALTGRVREQRGGLVMANPEYHLFDASEEYQGRLVPVYRATSGLAQPLLRRTIAEAVERFAGAIGEPLPKELRGRYNLIDLDQAVRDIHSPEDYAAARIAERRIAFDELLAVQLAIVGRKRRIEREGGAPAISQPAAVDGFLTSLPFRLTGAQERALADILGDIGRRQPMGRLLQGDVGSGKTVVALAAMLACAENGEQAALLAPTEVLAEQHFRTISSLLDIARNLLSFGLADLDFMSRSVRAVLLTGSRRARQRRNAISAIRNGSAGIAVGTHALIQDDIEFANLGLAIVDEQHRFGVEQRSALRSAAAAAGGPTPHLLVMTATPIPRSLALTAYGDLDISVIDELPPGRPPIVTRRLEGLMRAEAFTRAREEIAAGRQVFVICPLVDESEAVLSRAATEEFERLRREEFEPIAGRVVLLHGRMTAREKNDAMQRFTSGDAAVLVSTAVVEVGIDVPNASVMIIEGSDRFGIAQLHQFRGRVGRGAHQSHCFLLADDPSEEAQERLSLVERNASGFDLAQADLELRGPGDLFGTRQSGRPALRASTLLDGELIATTRQAAEQVLDDDHDLSHPRHAGLRALAARAAAGIIGESH